MKVKIGELDKRIGITEKITTTDNEGFKTTTYNTIYSCWASVNHKTGSEIYKNDADYSKKITRFLIRYNSSVNFNTDNFVKFRNVTYNIIYINNYCENNKYIEIVCEVIENV